MVAMTNRDTVSEDVVVGSKEDLRAPLARFGGEKPPAPAWFEQIIRAPYERRSVARAGSQVEYLAWGKAGNPGLMLLHGNSAHADWWRFTAPYLARKYRVVAPSLPGMGGSSHRPSYRMSETMADLLAVADVAGIRGRFHVVGHSYGGMIAMGMAGGFHERVATSIAVDAPFGDFGHYEYDTDNMNKVREPRYYASMAEALARFRYVPQQPTTNPWATDFIARTSLEETSQGYRWKFDQNYMTHSEFDVQLVIPPARSDQKLGYIWGEHTVAVPDEGRAVRKLLPPDTPFWMIPEAYHHVMVDQPIALVTAIAAMLDELERKR